MPEKKNDFNVRENRKENVRPDKGSLKIAGIFYGNKNLTDCMESVIKLHMEK